MVFPEGHFFFQTFALIRPQIFISLAPSVFRVQVLALSLSFSSKKNKLRVLLSSSSFSSFFYNAFRRYYRKFSIKNVGELWETKARKGRPHFFQSEKVYKFPSNTK